MLGGSDSRPRSTGRTVLVVDDERLTREIIAEVLRARGIEVSVARDRRDALARLTERRPALVVTDVTTPRLDGVALIDRIRLTHQGLRVLVITARAAAEAAAVARLLGADGYVNKPINLADMVASVERTLTHAQGRIARRSR